MSNKLRQENGYFIWTKGQRHKLSANFSSHEFDCQCSRPTCVEQKISIKLIEKIETVRTELGSPLYITSGFRCSDHQNDLRKELNTDKKQMTVPSGRVSQHELGNAADISPRTGTITQLRRIVEKVFDSIGVAKTFLHVDTRPKNAQGEKRIWQY
jgi:uncharacterized protein YcbK (DUF882 family)